MNIIDRDWIAARIPHQGAMCLLDNVRSWDLQRAHCVASSHRRLNNPLRSGDRLSAICAIEYAAQAMAVHSALLAAHAQPDVNPQRPAAGYLASARAVDFFVERLDDIGADLDIEVERLSADAISLLYQFSLRADERVLARGRATVVLNAAALTPEKTQ